MKSPQMAHKTLWMSIIAFNLIHSLMQRAAAQNNDPVSHLSFKGVLDHLATSHESFRVHTARPRKQAEARAHLIAVCTTKKLNLRPFRSELLAVKKRPKSYQLRECITLIGKRLEIQHDSAVPSPRNVRSRAKDLNSMDSYR